MMHRVWQIMFDMVTTIKNIGHKVTAYVITLHDL
jgi:hypothetical protein